MAVSVPVGRGFTCPLLCAAASRGHVRLKPKHAALGGVVVTHDGSKGYVLSLYDKPTRRGVSVSVRLTTYVLGYLLGEGAVAGMNTRCPFRTVVCRVSTSAATQGALALGATFTFTHHDCTFTLHFVSALMNGRQLDYGIMSGDTMRALRFPTLLRLPGSGAASVARSAAAEDVEEER